MRVDPSKTVCGYGNDCKHWHGWARDWQSDSEWNEEDAWRGKWHVKASYIGDATTSDGKRPPLHQSGKSGSQWNEEGAWRGKYHAKAWQTDKNSSDKWRGSDYGPLDYEMWNGGDSWEYNAKWDYCRSDNAHSKSSHAKNTLGNESRYGHGWSKQEGSMGYANKENQSRNNGSAAPKLLRAALNSLLGHWHSTDTSNAVQSHEIAMNIAPDRQGSAELSCITIDCRGIQSCEPVRFDGLDIMLGSKCKFYLDVSTDVYATWINSNDEMDRRKWTRGWVDLGCTVKKNEREGGSFTDEDIIDEVQPVERMIKFQ
jgi:hypothetical protein